MPKYNHLIAGTAIYKLGRIRSTPSIAQTPTDK